MAIVLKEEDVVIDVWCEPEDISPVGQFSDDKDVQHVLDEIESGNEWGWCIAVVRVVWLPFDGKYEDFDVRGTYIGYDTLGGCSYASKKDFIENSGYYEDMVDLAIKNLTETINSLKPGKVASDLLFESQLDEVEALDYGEKHPDLLPHMLHLLDI